MLSDIASRYYRALGNVLKNESKEAVKNDVLKLSKLVKDCEFEVVIKDPFQGFNAKMEYIKKLQLNRYLQNCIGEMIKNSRYQYVAELVHKLASDVRGENPQLTIWTSTVN